MRLSTRFLAIIKLNGSITPLNLLCFTQRMPHCTLFIIHKIIVIDDGTFLYRHRSVIHIFNANHI